LDTVVLGAIRQGCEDYYAGEGEAAGVLDGVVVANATQAADRRWTALDGRELYRHAKTAGYL